MTVTRVPASNPEPEVPITDPRWLASTQPDPTPEIDGGLDGRGTTRGPQRRPGGRGARETREVPDAGALQEATGVITRTLAVQGRIETGIGELEKWANEEGKR
jgi:hypothetical protein